MASDRAPHTQRSPPSGDEAAGEAAGRAHALTTASLLAELGRRFRVRYGRIEVVFHDGRPSTRVTVEHRALKEVDDGER